MLVDSWGEEVAEGPRLDMGVTLTTSCSTLVFLWAGIVKDTRERDDRVGVLVFVVQVSLMAGLEREERGSEV